MKNLILAFSALLFITVNANAQETAKPHPWTEKQLMEPATLAKKITDKKMDNILLICVGPDASIPGSVDAESAQFPENLANLKKILEKTPKDKEVVIYCGCCPFDRCPNVRPAFQLLKEMGFKNAKLLNLSKNIKTNWIDHGYPVEETDD